MPASPNNHLPENPDWDRVRNCGSFGFMTLKQHIHEMVDDLPDDSPVLFELRETLRMNQALKEAVADIDEGRTFTSTEFMAKVQERWPRKTSA
ncbi:MAG TPA: hypothetical protein VGM54_26740 [Chthoniobacter sp.]|jgi:hypothetical protein